MPRVFRIGTRGSPLALAQTGEARRRLADAHPDLASDRLTVVVIRTTGDRILDRTLAEVGGKGLFTKEIDQALLDGSIDLAVHSVKDLPTALPSGLVLAATLPRQDPRDALVADGGGDGPSSLATLHQGAVLGTASLRRQAQALALRPDLRVVPLRGNVHTRLKRVADGEMAATLLALAGLRRLDLAAAATPLAIDEMLPACGQGAIGITCRRDDSAVRDVLAAVDDGETSLCIAAERAMLAALDGSCRTPIAGLGQRSGGTLTLKGLIALPDGSALWRAAASAPETDAVSLGEAVGRDLRAQAAAGGWPGLP